MDVDISYLGLVRNVTGLGEERVSVQPDTTVRELLEQLTARHGDGFRHSLFRNGVELRSFTQICIDDRDIARRQGLETTLGDGKTVSIILGVYAPEGG